VLLDEIPIPFAKTVAVIFGLLWGSFLNVVIYRVPRDMSVVHPPSHCPSCGKPVKPYDNIPILSFLILRGRTRCCNTPMSVRYPLVEALGGLAAWAVFDAAISALPGETPAWRFLCFFLADLALALGLIAAAFIDAEHMFLPDEITIGGTVLGIATFFLRDMSIAQSIGGAVVGFLAVYVPFIFLYKLIRGFAGMGLGDAKLLMLAGAWFGWQGALFVLFAGAIQGSIGTIILLVFKGKIEEPESVRADREAIEQMAKEGDAEAIEAMQNDPLMDEAAKGKARIPFGPFLILACLECLIAGDRIFTALQAYLLQS
jgi:leader peptidase (prepilin peptidase)/N-methyltransferase